MSTSSFVYDVSERSFQDQVLKVSLEALVLVDFWAPWCEPCRALAPILEKIAEDYNGALRIAKVNSDEYQALATHFGVRSLPTVKFVNQGQLVNEFSGVQPEHVIRQMVEAYLGPVAATAQVSDTDFDQQLRDARAALADNPDLASAKIRCVELLARLGQTPEARAMFNALTAEDLQAEGAARAAGRLFFAEILASEPERGNPLAATREALKAAAQLLMDDVWDQGLETLLAYLRESDDKPAAKQALLHAFALVEEESLLVEARRSMSRLLF